MRKRSWRDYVWIFTSAALAGAYAITFTIGQIRSSDTHKAALQTQTTVKTETEYLRDVAVFADYIAQTNKIICSSLHLACPDVPSFPDPPRLPRLKG